MHFKRDEVVGIAVSLVVVVLFFSAIEFHWLSTFRTFLAERRAEQPIEVIDITGASGTTSVTGLLTKSFSPHGTLSKIVLQDTRTGSGEVVTEGTRVTVHYVGMLQDGTVFDNSYEKGMPYSFIVGEGTVIRGWEVGLVGMRVGGERLLVIPAAYGYGAREVGTIPKNATLLFSVELLSIE
jgi:hypothetical protein